MSRPEFERDIRCVSFFDVTLHGALRKLADYAEQCVEGADEFGPITIFCTPEDEQVFCVECGVGVVA